MYDFFTAELARFEANPIGQGASWLAIVALFGVGAVRPFLNLPVAFAGTAKILQFIVISAIGAVSASAFQSNQVTHYAMYLIASLVMLKVILDNWKAHDEGLGAITTFVAFNGFVVSLAGTRQMEFIPVVITSAIIHFGIAIAAANTSAPSSTAK